MSRHGREFKDTVYQQVARVGQALASPRRLELLDLLAQTPRSVEALAGEAGQTVANTSQHLQVLHRAGLVERERDGLRVTYRLASDEVLGFHRALRLLAESRLAEIERVTRAFLESRDLLEPVDRDDLLGRIRRGEAMLLDVRPPEEFRSGHIAGARNAPLGELERLLGELPRHRQIVAYCRGPYCVLSVDAVRLLRVHGFDAVRLEDGPADWGDAGLETVTEGAVA